eukprot:3705698-Rhodomonas_salina.3
MFPQDRQLQTGYVPVHADARSFTQRTERRLPVQASLLFEDMPGDKQSPNNGTFDKASVDKSPTGVKKRDFLTDSALFEDDSDDDVPTLREQMTSVARTLGVTLGLELEVVSDDDIEGYDTRLPKGYPEGTATLFVKEVFVGVSHSRVGVNSEGASDTVAVQLALHMRATKFIQEILSLP